MSGLVFISLLSRLQYDLESSLYPSLMMEERRRMASDLSTYTSVIPPDTRDIQFFLHAATNRLKRDFYLKSISKR